MILSILSQVPDITPAEGVGIVEWLLMAGVGAMAWFLRRITDAMDRSARAQEAQAATLQVLSERVESIEEELEDILAMSRVRAPVPEAHS